MNLNVIQALLTVALNEAQEPWVGTVPTLVNEAIKQVCQRRSFNCMKVTIPFDLNVTGDGPYKYELPTTFKELQSGANPLRNVNTPAYLGSLWRVFTRQEATRLNMVGLGIADRVAFLEQDAAGVWSLNFQGPIDMGYLPPTTQFEVDTYSFLPAVAAGADENELMRRYPMLILETAKMLVFSLGSDPDSIRAKREAMSMINGDGSPQNPGYFNQASADDSSRSVRGRTSRMGGY